MVFWNIVEFEPFENNKCQSSPAVRLSVFFLFFFFIFALRPIMSPKVFWWKINCTNVASECYNSNFVVFYFVKAGFLGRRRGVWLQESHWITQVAQCTAHSLQLHSHVNQVCPDLFVKCAHILWALGISVLLVVLKFLIYPLVWYAAT